MRTLAVWIVVFAVAAVASLAKDETVEALKAKVDSTPVQDQPPLCIHIAELQLRNADTFYTEGHIDEARDAVQDIVVYSAKARDGAKESQKNLKRVEISVRKMADKLADIKRTLAFEDQAPVDDAIQRLQEIRTSLLNEMFKKEKK